MPIREKANSKNILIALIIIIAIIGGCYRWKLLKESDTEEIEESGQITILFTGDIMLGRGVKYFMDENSVLYPFEEINQFLSEFNLVVGNLEGPIVENPPSFSDESLKFAFSPDVIQGLSFSNFNLLSLANNHTFDAGKAGWEETKNLLRENDINSVGHPVKCDEDFSFEKDDIILLAFNKTFSFNCSDEEIVEIIEKTRNLNIEKFVIVIFHWGEEYQPESSAFQQKLAHQVIDAGADLIIGSHPHTVQEIEEYKGKLIFYSLGNFIFDQYFSKETKQGLAVELTIHSQKLIYNLFPVESHLRASLMKEKGAREFLKQMALKSHWQLFDQIENGKIETKR